jgi:hypothetical protein
MPIPKVICCVCGQEVNKAQTLHIGDGKRACRSHENTVELSKHECDKIAQKKKEEYERVANKKKISEEKLAQERDKISVIQPECVICRKPGIRQEEWYGRLLVEMKKYEIIHGKPINPLLGDIRKVGGPLSGIACLFYVMWRGKNVHIKVPHKVYEFIQMQLSMGIEEPVLLVCQDCVADRKFTTLALERTEAAMHNDTFFQMAGLIHAAVEPHITRTAMKEMMESN